MPRKIILNVHIYGGLLCFSYLVLLGISVLNFNHPFGFTASPGRTTTWTQPVSLPGLTRTEGLSAQEALRARSRNDQMILHALGSFADSSPNPPGAWTAGDTYHVRFVRPGKECLVDFHPAQGIITISRTRTGFWAMVRDLHGLHAAYPDSLLAGTWAWYTDLCTGVVLFAGISGIYLWTRRRKERRIGLAVLGVAAAISLALMLLVTFRG